MREICATYETAPERHRQGEHTVSLDEKTGIQALEAAAPVRPMQPGRVEHQEFEYIRHGTLCLIANFDVATGQIIAPTLEPTRTEDDFVAHIERLLQTDPEGKWIIVADNLNIHQSASLVQWVARYCDLDQDLGVKGRSGILQSQASRAAFLSDYTHRIRFVYTPNHSSWLNQVEIWFSLLVRRLLKRARFASLSDLRQRILAFIDYYNQFLAHSFRWTYKGRPLVA